MFDSCWIVYWLGLHSNTGYFQHNKRLGLWSKLAADERDYRATMATPTPIATAIVLCFVFVIVLNALNRKLVGLMVSNNAIETKLFSIK